MNQTFPAPNTDRGCRALASVIALFRMALTVFLVVVAASPSVLFADPAAILEVSTATLAEGLTVVSITTTERLDERSWQHELLSNPRRALIRFRNFDTYPAATLSDRDDELVQKLRFGFHPEFDPPEVHVVLDLANNSVQVAEIRSAGRSLLIHVVRQDSAAPGPLRAPETVAPTPTPTIAIPPPIPPTPTPTSTIEQPFSPSPTPIVPIPPPSPSPTAVAPTVLPTPSPTPKAPTAQAPATVPATPIPDEVESNVSNALPRIEEIVVTSRGNGTTSVRITTNIPLKENSYGCYRMADPPARQVLSLIGVQATDKQSPALESRSEILDIDIKSTPIHRGARVDVMFHFSSESIGVIRVAQQGNHLVLLFG